MVSASCPTCEAAARQAREMESLDQAGKTLYMLSIHGVQEVVVSAATYAEMHKRLFPYCLYLERPGMISSFRCVLDGREMIVSTRESEP